MVTHISLSVGAVHRSDLYVICLSTDAISEGPATEQGSGERLSRKDYPEGPLGTCLGEDDS